MLIDATRADFIDRDIIEVIEDFMMHAPLKNIRVELKKSRYKSQGFKNKLLMNNDAKIYTYQILKGEES